jgi:hypothetical protein
VSQAPSRTILRRDRKITLPPDKFRAAARKGSGQKHPHMDIKKTYTVLAGATVIGCANCAVAQDWKDHAIEPVTNPLFFEDPLVHSEIRPLALWHNIDKSFATGGGDVRVFAAQIRYAVNDRLAIIATKDGYIDFDPGLGKHHQGWADIAAGLKYAVIDNPDQQLVVTPGLKIELPTGNTRVFQGNGSGEWDVFVSAIKGFDKFHVLGSLGARLPNNWDEETASLHYSLQLDYYACRWFIPFVSGNGQTVLSDGKGLPLNVEGYDLINFGSSQAKGETQIVLGTGFRSRLLANLDFGFGYEFGVTDPKGLFGDRYTVDFIFRF